MFATSVVGFVNTPTLNKNGSNAFFGHSYGSSNSQQLGTWIVHEEHCYGSDRCNVVVKIISRT